MTGDKPELRGPCSQEEISLSARRRDDRGRVDARPGPARWGVAGPGHRTPLRASSLPQPHAVGRTSYTWGQF